MLISIIVPCYNEEKVLRDTYRRLSTVMEEQAVHDYEILFIDDGSVDATPSILREFSQRDSHVNFIKFSRNFGHQPAVSAGITRCRGDLAVIIDADLQDPPELIPEMVRHLLETGSNVVYAVRRRRKGETVFKLACAASFYYVLSKLAEVSVPVNTGDFRVIDRKIINAFCSLNENNKYVRGLISWLGFKQTPYYYDRDPRFAGAPKYTFKKLLRLASNGIFYFSKKPLKIASTFGLLSVVAGAVLSGWILFNKLFVPQYIVSGWTSIILLVIYFGGVQLLSIGILGQYVGCLFDEIKRRPEYVLDEEIMTRALQPGGEPRSVGHARLRDSRIDLENPAVVLERQNPLHTSTHLPLESRGRA